VSPPDETSTTTTLSARQVRTLTAMAEVAGIDGAIRRHELGFGDRLVVKTRNSTYSMIALGDGTFAVSGGWFDHKGLSPATIGVNGCTFGGTAIRHDVVAGRGLFLEFENNVRTTRILGIRVEPRRPASELN
jgi:hypothetical protein